MAYIAPFRALRYDPSRVQLSQVATQPYDKISPVMQDAYYAASPHNLVRIILGKREPTDNEHENPYSRAASSFRDWRRQGVFLQDAQPSIYLYAQRFKSPGGKEELERRGFIALGKIEDYASGVVFRHEQTLAKPKADRLDLLRSARAHFGQIFMLYSDPNGEVQGLLTPKKGPDMELRDEYGVLHQVWKVSDPALIEMVRGKMRDKKLIIADGHHRYETALNYRGERRAVATSAGTHQTGAPRERSAGSSVSPREDGAELAPYEMVMMTFVDMESSGLVILPTHRVVHGLESFSAETMAKKAGKYFRVEQVDPSINAARADYILKEAGKEGTALLAVAADRAFLFTSPKAIGSDIFKGLSLRQQSLDVVQLHKALLEDVLGLSQESIRDQQNLSYVRDTAECLERVRSGAANVVFLMNPARMQQIRDIAFASEVLPQKSTDFYPKLLSGLTIYALE
ncbi:MAG: DUF1015 domain-containing protein [Terriglobales bacterium]